MRSLRTLYPVFAATLIAVFHLFYPAGNAPQASVNLVFLLLSPVGYIYRVELSYVFAALSWVLCYPLLVLVYKIDSANAVFSILIFNCLLAGCAVYKKSIEKDKRWCVLRLKEKEAVIKKSGYKLENLSETENRIRDEELTVAKVYEIAKKMSTSLKLDEIFNVFAAALKENFIFRRSDFLSLKELEDRLRVDKIYTVAGDKEASAASGPAMDYDELTKTFSESKDAAFFSRKADPDFFDRVHIESRTKTFTAIPLLDEKRVAGILTIEDLPYIDFERAIIVAMQFALEIKKVLLYERVEELAITDGLTGLYVRRYFLERLEEELNRSARYDFNFAFIMIDIDNFKKCNDTYGHLVGDVILKEVSSVIKASVREIDLVARYGGEEFSVILPETGRSGAALVAERIRQKIQANLFKAYDEKLNLTVSIGLSAYPKDAKEFYDLIEKADMALYVAKRSGKNIVCEYKK